MIIPLLLLLAPQGEGEAAPGPSCVVQSSCQPLEVFPNPWDCHLYHQCQARGLLDPTTLRCLLGHYFHPAWRTCVPEESPCTPQCPLPCRCDLLSQGSIVRDDGRCQRGGLLHVETSLCVDDSCVKFCSEKATLEVTHSDTHEASIQSRDRDFKDCPWSCHGDFSHYAEKTDCTKYYVCMPGGVGILTVCPADRPYFNGEDCTSDSSQCCGALVTSTSTSAPPSTDSKTSTSTVVPSSSEKSTTSTPPATTTTSSSVVTTATTSTTPSEVTTATTTTPPSEVTTATTTTPPSEVTTATITTPPSEVTTATTTTPPSEVTTATTSTTPSEVTTATTTIPPSDVTTATTSTTPSEVTTAAASTATPGVSSSSSSTQVTTSPSTSTTAGPTVGCLSDPDCRSKPLGYQVPDPDNCLRYYICLGDDTSLPDPFNCPPGQFFDPETNQCLLIEGETYPCLSSCDSICPYTCSDSDWLFDPQDCSRYYLCVQGSTFLLHCSDTRPYFDGESCTTDPDSCCSYPCPPYCPYKGKWIPHGKDCHKYYICLDVGTPTEDTLLTCKNNEVYDYMIGKCSSTADCIPLC